MSTGQAVTMPEGSFSDIAKSQLVFGGSDMATTPSRTVSSTANANVPEIETKENSYAIQNHVGKNSMKHEDSPDLVNCSHVFRPTKSENISSNFDNFEAEKSKELINNVEHKHPMNVGAGGDGPIVNEKILLLMQKSDADINHHGEPVEKSHTNTEQTARTVFKQPNKPKMPFRKASQTYAKAAQSLPVSGKFDESMKHVQVNEISPPKTDHQTNKLVNGCMEESDVLKQEHPLKDDHPIHPERRQKALRETIGHTTSFTDENLKPTETKFPEPDADVPKEDNTTEESQDSTIPESSIAVADGDCGSNSKLNNAPPRRETEKPPRMQKQRSQDRILLKQQRNSFEADSKRDNLSRGSSAEWVDSTGVDVHEFLIHVLRTCARDRTILLKIEQDMTSFVNDKTSDFMKFPPMSSYHRMLVHRVATYFCLDHNVDETGKCVIINKTSFSRLPDTRFADQFDPRQCDPPTGRREDDMRRSILKRSNQPRSFDRDDQRGGTWKDRQMSIEEREENYEKTRARIFNDAEANMNSTVMYGRRGVTSMQARLAYGERRSTSGGAELESVTRMPSQDSLTTRASSYSAISVLPRHSSYANLKSGSPNSVSSLNGGNGRMRGYGKSRHHMNVHPRPPTPNRRDGGGGTYYYMQNQNQGLPYLSPEGYQLVYPSGMPGGNGLSSQYSRYYQMPPPHARPHHGMPYPQGYNPYDESTQKSHGLNNPDYTMIPPNYPPSMAAVTTTVYSGVPGQHSVNYAYQPAIFRSAADPAIPVNPTQPMQAGPPQQGKQTPVMQGNQNYIQQSMPNSNYPPPYITGLLVNQSTGHVPGIKDAVQRMNSPNNNLQRGVITQPTPAMPSACQQPVSFNNQAAPNMTSSTTNEKFRQKGTAKDKLPLTNSSQKPAEDELGEKMQAIVLKNLQQQQQNQISEATKPDLKNTVTTALSPPNNLPSTLSTKRGQDPTQSCIPNDPATSNHIRAVHKSHGYQFQYPNGMQQQQQMQIYMMPANNPAGNSSYQAFPQYMAQPQPQHVVGPGMHLVYLNPSQVVGIDGSTNLPTPTNVHMYHPSQMPLQQMQAPQQSYEGSRGFVSNMNNNNAASVTAIESTQILHEKYEVNSIKTSDETGVEDTASQTLVNSSNGNGNSKNVDDKTENTEAGNIEADSVTSPQNEVADQVNLPVKSGLSESGQASSTNTSHVTNVTNQVYVSHNHPVTPQHPGTPLLVSNIAQDYRIAGMNMAGPVAYPAGVIPKYPMYQNLSPASYMYLPAAAAAPRNTKLSDMKMYQTQPPQPPAALMAVQLPTQNPIQLVQAPSIQQQNAVYYAPPGYVATDYSRQSQAPPPQAPNRCNSSENDAQYDLSLQKSNNNATESISGDLLHISGDFAAKSGTIEKASKEDTELGDTESVPGKQ